VAALVVGGVGGQGVHLLQTPVDAVFVGSAGGNGCGSNFSMPDGGGATGSAGRSTSICDCGGGDAASGSGIAGNPGGGVGEHLPVSQYQVVCVHLPSVVQVLVDCLHFWSAPSPTQRRALFESPVTGGVPVGVAEAIVVPPLVVPPLVVPPFVFPGVALPLVVPGPVGFVFDAEFVRPQHLFAGVGTQFGGGGGCGLLAMQQ
jgi:hypothetical protein